MGTERETDRALIREIEAVIKDHLDSIKRETHVRVLKLRDVDREKAWEEIAGAVDAYGTDMATDATHWLRTQVQDYASARWSAAAQRGARRAP